jgi:hypothetical protein
LHAGFAQQWTIEYTPALPKNMARAGRTCRFFKTLVRGMC